MVQEPQNSPKPQGPATKEEYSIRYVDGDVVYSEHHFDIEGIPVSPPYRVKNPDAIPIQKVGAAPTTPNQSLAVPDGVLTEPVTKTNQPKPAKPKEPIKTQPGLGAQVLKGLGSFAWDALDLTNGVAKGIIASVTYGAVSGALPHSTDSVTNRVGQVLGTTAVELVGAFLATTGGGAAGGGLLATATGVGALVGIPAVVVGAGINTAGAILIGGASANAGRLYNAPPPQYMMSESSEDPVGTSVPSSTSGSAPDVPPDPVEPTPTIPPARRNAHLAGKNHPKTNVPFNENSYPVFDSAHDVSLPSELHGPTISDNAQFKYATKNLWERMQAEPEFMKKFTPKQIEQIKAGKPEISGFTWHHHEDGVTLQLVDRKTHSKTGHDGGRKATGGRP